MIVLRGGFFVFDRCLEHVGDFGTLGAAFTARLYALQGDDVGGTSIDGVRLLPGSGGAAVLAGSFRFLDPAPCSAGTWANAWTRDDVKTVASAKPLAPPSPEAEEMMMVIGSVRHLERTSSRIWPQSSTSHRDCLAPK